MVGERTFYQKYLEPIVKIRFVYFLEKKFEHFSLNYLSGIASLAVAGKKIIFLTMFDLAL